MDTLERGQIRLIMEHLGSETLRKTAGDLKDLKADHAAKGLLQSGATIKRSISTIEERASQYVEQAVDQVSAVAKDLDAFAVISSSLTVLFRGFEEEAGSLNVLAGGKAGTAAKASADKLFNQMRDRIFQQLRIHQFSFTKPSQGDMAASRKQVRSGPLLGSEPQAKRNSGGKVLAKHWDALWAEIAVQLWAGDLKPASQADIKRAMFDWLNEQGVDAGDTAVTERARALWQRMEAEE